MRVSLLLFILSVSCSLFAQCPEMIWQDEFEGTSLDLSKWSFETGDACNLPQTCGWGNNELQWYRSENTTVNEGTLKITAKRETASNRLYTSSRIRTINKGDWTYGRFEALIKLPKGKGLWPAFWMLPTEDKYGSWPQSGEIDIMELIGQEPATAHGTIHYGNLPPLNRSSGESYILNSEEGTFNDNFHQFAIEWEEGEIRWIIDDYLYSTKSKSDVAPLRWPFDHDFHLLLNVAVGGNWPGNPDASTVFPQNMEVDYVRVYNGYKPYLSGNRKVSNQAKGMQYQVKNVPENATVHWVVTGDANITEGQSTENIVVDWGSESGEVSVSVDSDCGTQEISLKVMVESAFGKEYSLENFDDPARLSLDRFTGSFDDAVSNPAPNEVNNSDLVGKYSRNSSESFDILAYNISDFENAAPFLVEEKRFFLDVYTDAPEGTLILLQLENKNLSTATNYPRGRHSRFEAYTSKQNEWERLEFRFLDQPDNTVPDNSINQMILLFASNTRTSNTYYFDNFDTYGPQTIVSVEEKLKPGQFLFSISPNPIQHTFSLKNLSDEIINRIDWIDLSGKYLKGMDVELLPGQTTRLSKSNFASGLYLMKVWTTSGKSQNKKILISGN